MKKKWGTLALCLLVPLAMGGLAAILTKDGTDAFALLRQPPLSPPAWIFPVVWTILFTLMGVASYLVLTSGAPGLSVKRALSAYGVQLAFNFCWTIIFFDLGWYLFAFLWLVVLWLLILVTLLRFYSISKTAGYLLLPYLAWVTFAGYLNFAIHLLN